MCKRSKIFAGLFASVMFLAVLAAPAFAVAPPVITDFSPSSGPADTHVTINGTGFGPEPGQVKFIGLAAEAILDWNDTHIVAMVSSLSMGSGRINVMTPANGSVTSRDNFTVATGPVDGVCGTANGQITTSAPTSNLCARGIGSTVTGAGPWNWSCAGSNGGAAVNCTAWDPLNPPTDLSAGDPDNTFPGVDGRDFHVSWTPSSSAGVTQQQIYILPQGTIIDTGTQTAVATFNDNTTGSWTGDAALTRDSANNTLTAGNYQVYVVAIRPSQGVQSSTGMTAVGEPPQYKVTPSVVGGGGIFPSTPQYVSSGGTTSFTVTVNSGYYLSLVSGCGGALSANTYTTGPVTADCTVTAAFLSTSAAWYDLGTLGGTLSRAYGVSANGTIVAGVSTAASGSYGFRWDQAGGMVNLGMLPSCYGELGYYPGSGAYGVSADGNVIVGNSTYCVPVGGSGHAVVWTPAGIVDLGSEGTLIGASLLNSMGIGVSADGNAAVGLAEDKDGAYHTVIWRGGGLTDLGLWSFASENGLAVSGDGTVVAGTIPDNGYTRAARWTEGTGVVSLGTFPGGTSSEANSISADGNVIVGRSDDSTGHSYAFRWTQAGGLVKLGALNGDTDSNAFGVSADGSVVVGYSGNYHAFRWTQATGMLRVNDWLAAGGIDASTVNFSIARGVSGDGNTVVGEYYTDQSFTSIHAFYAHAVVPPPGPAAKLVWHTQPGGAQRWMNLDPQPVLYLEDAFGKVETGDSSSTVTLALTTPGGATLGGTTTVTLISGVATFTNLTVDKAGSYTLTPSSSLLAINSPASNSFTILGPVDGVCGAANGQAFTTAPTDNLCSAGAPSAVTGDGPWYWSCSGQYGGNAAFCSASYTTPYVQIYGTSKTFGLLQPAYDAAADNDIIQAQGVTLAGDLSLNSSKAVTINGGYDASYNLQTGYTYLQGRLTVGAGLLVAGRLVIE